VGTVVTQAGSGAQGKLITALDAAGTSVVVYSTNGIPFVAVGAITITGATPTNIVPSVVAEADYTDVFPKWSKELGGQYIKEETYPASEATMDWDRQTRNQAGIMKRTCAACPEGKVNNNAGALLVRTGTAGIAQCVALTCPAHRAYATDRSCTPCASKTFRFGTVDTDRTTAATCSGTCAANEFLSEVGGAMKCTKCALGKVRASGDKIIRADLVKLTIASQNFGALAVGTVVTQSLTAVAGATGTLAVALPNAAVTEIYVLMTATNGAIAFTTATTNIITVTGGTAATAAAPTAVTTASQAFPTVAPGDTTLTPLLAAGAVSPAAASVMTTPATVCTPVYCPDDTVRDTSGNCCACAAGKTRNDANTAGNLAAYEALQLATTVNAAQTCVATLCKTDEYNTGAAGGFACAACADGKTNVLGDDASAAVAGVCHDVSCGKDGVGASMLYHRFDFVGKKCVACNSWEAAPEGIVIATATESTECTALTCAINEYVAADHTCTTCAAWESATAGASRATPTTCTVGSCTVNEWVDATHADNICRPCPAGTEAATTTLRTDTTGIAVCKDTAAATQLCKENQYVSSHACVACATGFTNAAGDDPTLADTVCDAVPAVAATPAVHTLCAADEHVVNHACVACPVGTKNAAKDDTHYHDTACAAEICLENFHVECTGTGATKACVCKACGMEGQERPEEILKTNTAGDDCSKGVTTFCV
jgi:hypothetical protein